MKFILVMSLLWLGGCSAPRILAGGGLHTCGVAKDSTVRCWGRNLEGQLGDGTFTSSSAPVTVPGVANVVELTAGIHHTCARTDAGAVFCWGRNTWGQLGDGTLDSRSTPVRVLGLSENVLQIRAGYHFTCAIVGPAGVVKCWGLNNWGQLGNGTHDPAMGLRIPASVTLTDGAPLTGVERIEAGGHHVCAQKDKALYCWGATAFGNSALGFEVGPDRCDSPYRSVPLYCAKRAYLSEAQDVVDFMTAQYATCVMAEHGRIKCWGDNRGFQLGTDAVERTCNSPVDGEIPCSVHGLPVEIEGTLQVERFATGSPSFFVCGNGDSRDVICWGSIVMTGWATESLAIPRAVSLSGRVPRLEGLAAGAYHVCGSTTDREVYCWGNNSFGQLGSGFAEPTSTPVRVVGF